MHSNCVTNHGCAFEVEEILKQGSDIVVRPGGCRRRRRRRRMADAAALLVDGVVVVVVLPREGEAGLQPVRARPGGWAVVGVVIVVITIVSAVSSGEAPEDVPHGSAAAAAACTSLVKLPARGEVR